MTVFSPKGGTGKTVIATNLAVALAKHGGKRTLLLDLDLQFGDAAIMLGIEPDKTIYDLVAAPGELDSEKLAGYTTRHASGLDVLPAPLRPEDAELVTEAKLARLLEVARESYDVIVVDTSPFFHGPMLATLDRTDELLLLCGLDVPTLKNVRLSLQTLELLSFPPEPDPRRPQPRELEGRDEAEGGRGGARAGDRFEIPSDRAVPLAVNRGNPAVLADPKADFSRAIREMAKSARGGAGGREAARSASLATLGGASRGPPRPPQAARTATRGTGRRRARRRVAGHRRRRAGRAHASDPYAELKTRIHHACIAKLGPQLFAHAGRREDLAERVLRAVTEQLALDRTPLTREERRQLVREIADDILGYGPLEPFLRDDSVTEVMVNNFDRVYVERRARSSPRATFVDNAHLLRIIDKIVSQVGRRIDEASPMVDARLPDGSRVNAIIPPLSLRGPTLTIRKFSRDPYTMDDLITFGTLTPKAAQFLAACVKGKLNVLISGGTGTGKTTTLNATLGLRPERRAHRHDRGRGRAPAPAGPRDHARGAPAEHRGRGRSPDPRARPERPAHAPRPDHRRRGPRRRDPGHAPGDEHGPRGLADHDPRQHPARRACRGSRRWS